MKALTNTKFRSPPKIYKNVTLLTKHMKLSEKLQYWKDRCKAAELFIEESPCDPDTSTEQIVAYGNWQTLKNKEAEYEK